MSLDVLGVPHDRESQRTVIAAGFAVRWFSIILLGYIIASETYLSSDIPRSRKGGRK